MTVGVPGSIYLGPIDATFISTAGFPLEVSIRRFFSEDSTQRCSVCKLSVT